MYFKAPHFTTPKSAASHVHKAMIKPLAYLIAAIRPTLTIKFKAFLKATTASLLFLFDHLTFTTTIEAAVLFYCSPYLKRKA